VRSARRANAPLAAGLVVAAYAAALRRYGIFDYVDEGLLLVQALRVARGQVPYVDFHTGYGPLYFRLQAWLLAAGGWAAIRWALVAVQGAAGALLFVLARRLAGPALAWAAVALEVAFFLPVAPGRGAPFNAPYPAWYAGLAGVALAVLLGGEAPARPWRAAVAGLIAGVVAAMKPSSGLLLAAGAAAAVVLGEVRDGGGGWVARALLALVALAAVALVLPTGFTVAAWVLVPPVVALAALGARRGVADADALRHLVPLAAGFVAVAGTAFAPALAALGSGGLAREIGAGVAALYALPFPWPAGVAAAGGLVALVAAMSSAAVADVTGVLAASAAIIGTVLARRQRGKILRVYAQQMDAKRTELVAAIENQISHAIDLFYGEINAAIQPLTAFCTAQRAHYQQLVDRIDELDSTFEKLRPRVMGSSMN